MNKTRMRPDWNTFKRQQLRVYGYVKIHKKEMPLAKECELCPEDDKITKPLHRHHPDYNEPWFFVTACPKCHGCAKTSQIELT